MVRTSPTFLKKQLHQIFISTKQAYVRFVRITLLFANIHLLSLYCFIHLVMAWLSYLSTGWEISTLHTILLEPNSGVFAWICSHGGCICSFPKEILEMPDKHPPAECWGMGTLCFCWAGVESKEVGNLEEGNRGGKEMPHFFSQLFPFAFISPFPSPSPFCPCQAGCMLCCGCDSDLISVQVIDLCIFCRTSRGQVGTKISNNKLFL